MAKIVIIDDDPDVVEAGRLILEKEGHEVASAPNKTKGMEVIHAFDPDMLVLDVMMDQPDEGIVMAQQLRWQGFKKPILMVTSLGKVTGLEYDLDEELLPVDAFMEKPLAPDTLIEAVNKLLAGKEA